MIALTRLNGSKVYINAEMIRLIETTPDTILTLIDEKKILVQESADVVVERFIEYKWRVNHPQITAPGASHAVIDDDQ
jgi:flagellar protein FlbD